MLIWDQALKYIFFIKAPKGNVDRALNSHLRKVKRLKINELGINLNKLKRNTTKLTQRK